MIYITGDTHGDMKRIINIVKTNVLTGEDAIIILGDAGINLQPEGSGWVVYIGERGNMYFEVQCNTILKACLEYIRKFTYDDDEIEAMEKELIVALGNKTAA